jgi:hypothetical protein
MRRNAIRLRQGDTVRQRLRAGGAGSAGSFPTDDERATLQLLEVQTVDEFEVLVRDRRRLWRWRGGWWGWAIDGLRGWVQ